MIEFLINDTSICSSLLLINRSVPNDDTANVINTEYIKKFWVGLMDGDGSIQVIIGEEKVFNIDLLLKLRFCIENFNMLNFIKTI